MSLPEAGLFIALKEDTPTIVRFKDQEVFIYLDKLKTGQHRARFVAERDIEIISPSRVKKGWLDKLTQKVANETAEV